MAALLELLDEPDDGRMALRERGLVGEIGGCGGQQASASTATTPRSRPLTPPSSSPSSRA